MTPTDPNQGEKRRFRFRLRSLLVVMALVSVALAIVAEPVLDQRRQRHLLEEAERLGARIRNHGKYFDDNQSLARSVLSNFDASYNDVGPYELDFSGTKITDDDLSSIADLRYISVLNLAGTRVTDDSLPLIVESMPYLVHLELSDTQVTDEGIAA